MLARFNNNYKNMNAILEPEEGRQGTLWLGDYTAALNQQVLKQRGIRTVLTVASGLNIKYQQGMDINHKIYQLLDVETANIKRIFQDTYQQIHEGLERGSVLVHCAAGVSRSASTVIAYLMKSKAMTFQEAFTFVRSKRPVICPNFGFQRQLRQYERELQSQTKSEIPQEPPKQMPLKAVQNFQVMSQQMHMTEKKPRRQQQLTPLSKPTKPVSKTTSKVIFGRKIMI